MKQNMKKLSAVPISRGAAVTGAAGEKFVSDQLPTKTHVFKNTRHIRKRRLDRGEAHLVRRRRKAPFHVRMRCHILPLVDAVQTHVHVGRAFARPVQNRLTPGQLTLCADPILCNAGACLHGLGISCTHMMESLIKQPVPAISIRVMQSALGAEHIMDLS